MDIIHKNSFHDTGTRNNRRTGGISLKNGNRIIGDLEEDIAL